MVTKTMKEIIATVVSVACTATLLVCAMKFDMRLSHIIAFAGCTNTLLLWFVFGGKQWWKRIVTGCICAAIIVHFFWAFPAEGADCKTFSQISSEEKLLAFDNEYYFGNYRKVIEMYEEEA